MTTKLVWSGHLSKISEAFEAYDELKCIWSRERISVSKKVTIKGKKQCPSVIKGLQGYDFPADTTEVLVSETYRCNGSAGCDPNPNNRRYV